MRLLTFLQTAENQKEITFDAIEKGMQIPADEVESFIIEGEALIYNMNTRWESLHFSRTHEDDPLQDRSFGSKSGDRRYRSAHVHQATLGPTERQARSVEGESIADQSESEYHRGDEKRIGMSGNVLEEFSLWRSVVNTVLSSCHHPLKGDK